MQARQKPGQAPRVVHEVLEEATAPALPPESLPAIGAKPSPMVLSGPAHVLFLPRTWNGSLSGPAASVTAAHRRTSGPFAEWRGRFPPPGRPCFPESRGPLRTSGGLRLSGTSNLGLPSTRHRPRTG